jgi:hypothetical protein
MMEDDMARSAEVDAYMAKLDHAMSAQVEQLRTAILDADARVNESIKWNAPSFFIDDHFATFSLHYPDRVQIVMHAGAKVNQDASQFEVSDPSGLLKWAAVDRASVTFGGKSEVDERLAPFLDILRQWIALTS